MREGITFHRDGRVTANGEVVGKWRRPDPSGAPWARTPVWIFTAWDGWVANGRTRDDLRDDAASAWLRRRTSRA